MMPSEDAKILKFNQYRKSDKTPSFIYADLASLIEVIDRCKNDFEKSCKTKVVAHITCWCSMSTIWTFDVIEKKVRCIQRRS